ncbi:MAG TPA: DNA repair protein RecN [Bacteroidales bacterium]|nr:DNA repair protein RecN [Bacteroidales bacterium]
MLLKLSVQNYALIKELDVEFEKNGLTIITGETGAGKSILLGALSLILGSRADTGVLLDKEQKCIVEGTFNVEEYDLDAFFEGNSLDYDSIATLRREINPAGKSRAFINDTPVNLNLLKELGEKLIDIHSQHQTLMLNNNSFQLNMIDSFAGLSTERKDYYSKYNRYNNFRKEYIEAKASLEKSKADLEYYSFQLEQIEKASLKKGEQHDLEAEQEILSHAEEIKQSLTEASALFSQEGSSVLSMVRAIKACIIKIKSHHPSGESLLSRIESSLIELDDLASEIEKISSTIEADPDRLSFVNERLNTIYTLIQKHKVKDCDELLITRDELRSIVNSIVTADEKIALIEARMNDELEGLKKAAFGISGRRKSVLEGIENKITDMLKQLGMPNAKFRIELTQVRDFTPTGIDQADFMFSANRQIAPENLARIASGGELSRVMLSLKSLLTKYNNLPTIIFDEIDSGVSGEVADRVGQILSKMGQYMQVINITHLPQVASRGSRHYHVYKDDVKDSTFTRVKLLSRDERIIEVARLLSGSKVTEAAIENARELLGSAFYNN